MLFASINLQDMEGAVIEWVVENELGGNEDSWEDNEWAFYEELSLKDHDEDIFDSVDETGTQSNISSEDGNFHQFFVYALDKAKAFFDGNGREIDKQEYESQVNACKSCVISISECHPDG